MTDITRDAVLSPCGRYRYILRRGWVHASRRVLFVMLNPSTADADVDDPTVRRCMGFARTAGFGALDIGNLYAWRATDPDALAGVEDPVGPLCDRWLERLATGADAAVLAWGASGEDVPGFAARAEAVTALVQAHVAEVYVLGRTKAGLPRHPLYLAAATPWERVGGGA